MLREVLKRALVLAFVVAIAVAGWLWWIVRSTDPCAGASPESHAVCTSGFLWMGSWSGLVTLGVWLFASCCLFAWFSVRLQRRLRRLRAAA